MPEDTKTHDNQQSQQVDHQIKGDQTGEHSRDHNDDHGDNLHVEPVRQEHEQLSSYQVAVPETSYNGVRGWLGFFVVAFGLAGLGNIFGFFVMMASLSGGETSLSLLPMSLSSLAIGVTTIIAAVNIATRRRAGRTAANAALVVMMVAAVVNNIAYTWQNMASNANSTYDDLYVYSYSAPSSNNAPLIVMMIGATAIQLGTYALAMYYFKKSRRVEETLVE